MADEHVVAVWSGTLGLAHAVLIPPDGLVLGRELLPPTDDDRISRVHARVDRVDGRLVVSDAGSRNGTHVDGFALDGESADVKPGAVIRTGRTVWMIIADVARLDVARLDVARQVQAIVDTVRAAAPGLQIHATLIEGCLVGAPQHRELLEVVAKAARARAHDGGELRGNDLEVARQPPARPAVWAVFPGTGSAAAAARRLAAKLGDASTRELDGGDSLVEASRGDRRATITCPPSTAYLVEVYEGETLIAAGYTIDDSAALAVATAWFAGIGLEALMEESSFIRAVRSPHA